jgi:hypothetical protein
MSTTVLDISGEQPANRLYTRGSWKLAPHTWQRLVTWCKQFVEYGTFQESLEFTLCFLEEDIPIEKLVIEGLAGLRILFRGLCIKPNGIFLRGVPSNIHSLKKCVSVRNHFSDTTQVFDVLLLQWTRKPTLEILTLLEKSLQSWDEAYFGELAPYRWIVGDVTFWTPEKIAHRALIAGPDHKKENSIQTISSRCQQGLSSEIDIWFHEEEFWIGHDAPRERVTLEFLTSEFLWIHAKNGEAFYKLQKISNEKGLGLRIFYHTQEHYALTTLGDTIILPGVPDVDGFCYMMPEMDNVTPTVAAKICSDFS